MSHPQDRIPEPSKVSAADARAALEQAQTLSPVTARDRGMLVGFTAGLGLLVGLLTVLVWWAGASNNTVLLGVSMIGYAIALAILLLIHRRAKAAPRGFARSYRVGLMGTMVLYAIGVTWFSTARDPVAPGWLAVAFAALVALPCLLAAAKIRRL